MLHAEARQADELLHAQGVGDEHSSRFSAALLDPQRPCPEGLFSANGADPASRFAVYRNNVQSSLINALADSYPVVSQLVGDEFFRAMAGLYVRSYPPQGPLINDYGKDFAEFIDRFEPAASVPYLADVARLERLRVQAYHAADAQPLSHEQIAAALSDPQALSELTVGFHPSLNLLTSAFAVVCNLGRASTGRDAGRDRPRPRAKRAGVAQWPGG